MFVSAPGEIFAQKCYACNRQILAGEEAMALDYFPAAYCLDCSDKRGFLNRHDFVRVKVTTAEG